MSARKDCQQDPGFLAARKDCQQVLAENPPVSLKASCSSTSSVQLAAHHSQGNCAATILDEDGDASTTASISEPPPETPLVRWADLKAWEEKEEEEALLPPQVLDSARAGDRPCSVDGTQKPAAVRTKWADLADSDDEQVPQTAAAAAAAAEIMPPGKGHSGNTPLKAVKRGGKIPITAALNGGTGGQLTKLSGTSAGAAAADGHAAPAARCQQQCVALSRDAGQVEPSSDAVTWLQQRHQQQHKQKPKVFPSAARNAIERGGNKNIRQTWSQNRGKLKPGAKHQCQFLVGIEEEPTFQVKRRLLGPHGQHMKAIAEASGVKLRLRGRGSGFLEGVEQEESVDPLMLCVSALDAAAYKHAVKLTRELLDGIQRDFRRFCMDAGSPVPSLVLHMHEGARPGSR